MSGETTKFQDCGSEENGDFDEACYNKYIAEVNDTETPVDPAQTEEPAGNGLVVAVAAVVVFSVVIGAGAVMYSKGMFGGSGAKDSQAPS